LRKSWSADSYGTFEDFAGALRSAPFSDLIQCDSWEVCGDLMFTDSEGLSSEQMVVVVNNKANSQFNFRLRQIACGSLKGFWLTEEVRFVK